MTALCPACWRIVPLGATHCTHCGAHLAQLDQRAFREKLLAALSHPDRDTVIRAARALAARRDPAATDAIEPTGRRFTKEPHVVAALLDALSYIGGDHARRIARDALGHRSFIVRRAAAQLLQHIGHAESTSGCDHMER